MDKLKERIKKAVIRLVAKKVVDKVGKERWEASKGKVGAVVATLAYLINNTLPAFGIDFKIPDDIAYTIVALGFGTSLYGVREAQEKLDDHVTDVEKKVTKKEK